MKKSLTKQSPATRWQRVLKWAVSPVGSTLLIGLALAVISLICVYLVRAYTSDDVIWENALLTWHPFGGSVYYADAGVSYIAKLPLYWLVSLFFDPGRKVMLLTSLILLIVNFIVIYRSSLYFLRISKVVISRYVLLPFLWLASFGIALSQQFFSPNLHNIEIGGIFLFLVAIAKFARKEYDFDRIWKRALVAIGLALFIALMILNDRYFVYFGLVPGIIFIALYRLYGRISTKRVAAFFGFMALSGVFYLLYKPIVRAAGIVLVSGDAVAGGASPQIVDFNAVWNNLLNTFHSLLVISGGDFFGQKITSGLTVITILNACLVIITLVITFKLAPRGIFKNKKTPNVVTEPNVEMQALSLSVLFVFVVYTLSTLSLGIPNTYRYVILAPYILTLLLAYAMYTLPHKKIIAGILILAILANIGSSIIGVKRPSLINKPYNYATDYRVNQQSYNYDLINLVKAAGLTKGYGSYWSANINNYLSKGTVHFLPVKCDDGVHIEKFKWLLDDAQFNAPASRTFYVEDPTYTMPLMCSPDAVLKDLGPADQVLTVDGITVNVYNYDITSRLVND